MDLHPSQTGYPNSCSGYLVSEDDAELGGSTLEAPGKPFFPGGAVRFEGDFRAVARSFFLAPTHQIDRQIERLTNKHRDLGILVQICELTNK